jgi:hypothetical protein
MFPFGKVNTEIVPLRDISTFVVVCLFCNIYYADLANEYRDPQSQFTYISYMVRFLSSGDVHIG